MLDKQEGGKCSLNHIKKCCEHTHIVGGRIKKAQKGGLGRRAGQHGNQGTIERRWRA